MKTYKGKFRPKNPEKYRGDPTNIIYRSRWEFIIMKRFDADPSIIWWASEETVIPYISPVDNRYHRYFMDFTVRLKTKDNSTKTLLIEVKPESQTVPPVLKEGANPDKKYIQKVMQYGINKAKWDAARKYCADRKWDFVIFTEKEIGIKF